MEIVQINRFKLCKITIKVPVQINVFIDKMYYDKMYYVNVTDLLLKTVTNNNAFLPNAD